MKYCPEHVPGIGKFPSGCGQVKGFVVVVASVLVVVVASVVVVVVDGAAVAVVIEDLTIDFLVLSSNSYIDTKQCSVTCKPM